MTLNEKDVEYYRNIAEILKKKKKIERVYPYTVHFEAVGAIMDEISILIESEVNNDKK